jgi:hypothetical protein
MLFATLFAVTLVGLGLYAILVRRTANGNFVPMLSSGVVLLGIAGIGILRLLPTYDTETTLRTYVALTMLWVGWIGLSALIAQAMTRRMPDLAPAPSLIGALATFAPLTGFLIAKTLT